MARNQENNDGKQKESGIPRSSEIEGEAQLELDAAGAEGDEDIDIFTPADVKLVAEDGQNEIAIANRCRQDMIWIIEITPVLLGRDRVELVGLVLARFLHEIIMQLEEIATLVFISDQRRRRVVRADHQFARLD